MLFLSLYLLISIQMQHISDENMETKQKKLGIIAGGGILPQILIKHCQQTQREYFVLAIENNADIVGLCALMTTTMVQIDKVIEDLKDAGCNAKVMVGGAAVTQEYADSAGADAYAPDGVKAVELAKELVQK
jgi:DUF1009 family protein